jgi:3',5'-cyclic-AMP phosphodiesterase
LIFLHHNVLSVGSAWLDKYTLRNAQDFWSVVDRCAKVKAIICGHVHQEYAAKHGNVDFFATPSSAWQFAPNNAAFKLDVMMPGYRYLDLYPDGSYKTAVVRVPYNKAFVPDLGCKGY